jgi:hypothetical protein
MANRTIQFYGYAYGTTPVQLNAHINGEVVFSGAVTTIDEPLPVAGPDMTAAPLLFSVADSALFPDTFSGSYPMTVSVATGEGVALGNVFCNYMQTAQSVEACVSENSSIANNTLTVGTVTSGAFAVGQVLEVNGAKGAGTITGANRAPDFYYVVPAQTATPTTITGWALTPIAGTSTVFESCYEGVPANSDGTGDPRSSVAIDGVTQNPPRDGSNGTWTWILPQGSTLSCNLNVSVGNVAP